MIELHECSTFAVRYSVITIVLFDYTNSCPSSKQKCWIILLKDIYRLFAPPFSRVYSEPCNCWNQEEQSLHSLFQSRICRKLPWAGSGRLSNPLFCISMKPLPSSVRVRSSSHFHYVFRSALSPFPFPSQSQPAVHIVATPIWPCSCSCLLPQLFIGLKTCSLSTVFLCFSLIWDGNIEQWSLP